MDEGILVFVAGPVLPDCLGVLAAALLCFADALLRTDEEFSRHADSQFPAGEVLFCVNC